MDEHSGSEAAEEDSGGGICQFEEHTFDASNPEAELVPGITVGELLERVGSVDVSLSWTGWADNYLEPAPIVGTITTLHITLLSDTTTFIVRDSEFDDEVCHDWIEITATADLATADDVLVGSNLLASVHVNLRDEIAALEIAASFGELGTTLVWPAEEPRSVPEEAYIEFDVVSPTGDFRPPSSLSGDVEMNHVWYVLSEGGFLWRVLEYFSIADVGE